MKYILGIISIFIGEFYLKNWIEVSKKEGETKDICESKATIHKYHNYGAFLNIGEKVTPVVTGVSVVLSILITILFVITLGKAGKSLLKVGLTLLLGGAFSNTYDRLCRGYVVDYISFTSKSKKFSSIVFNISDFCIIIGSMIIAISSK